MPNDPTAQWQIPIGLQLVPAAFLGLGTLTLKESTRWLTKKGRHDEAWESLKWIRASDSPEIADEMDEIRMGVEIENSQTEGFHIKGVSFTSSLLPSPTPRICQDFLLTPISQSSSKWTSSS